jgi:hypothetical protein
MSVRRTTWCVGFMTESPVDDLRLFLLGYLSERLPSLNQALCRSRNPLFCQLDTLTVLKAPAKNCDCVPSAPPVMTRQLLMTGPPIVAW